MQIKLTLNFFLSALLSILKLYTHKKKSFKDFIILKKDMHDLNKMHLTITCHFLTKDNINSLFMKQRGEKNAK